jgi:hypothetical protein
MTQGTKCCEFQGAGNLAPLLVRELDETTPAGPTPRQIGAGLVLITSLRPALFLVAM